VDGLELCRRIRNDYRFAGADRLLTAKASSCRRRSQRDLDICRRQQAIQPAHMVQLIRC
jgi:hypothetical protein